MGRSVKIQTWDCSGEATGPLLFEMQDKLTVFCLESPKGNRHQDPAVLMWATDKHKWGQEHNTHKESPAHLQKEKT